MRELGSRVCFLLFQCHLDHHRLVRCMPGRIYISQALVPPKTRTAPWAWTRPFQRGERAWASRWRLGHSRVRGGTSGQRHCTSVVIIVVQCQFKSTRAVLVVTTDPAPLRFAVLRFPRRHSHLAPCPGICAAPPWPSSEATRTRRRREHPAASQGPSSVPLHLDHPRRHDAR